MLNDGSIFRCQIQWFAFIFEKWLHRRLLERDQTGRQRSITDMFARVALNKPRPKHLECAIAVSNASCDDTCLPLPLS